MGPELTGRVFELYVARLQFGLDGIFEGSGTDAFGCHVAIFGERLSDITMKVLRRKKLRGCSWRQRVEVLCNWRKGGSGLVLAGDI